MKVLRVCYKSGVRFDEAYYVATHLPLSASVPGPHSLKRIEMTKVTASADGSAPPYQVIFSAYFNSAEDVQKALQSPRMSELVGDVPKYYDGAPDIMIGEVVAQIELGDRLYRATV
jgi:uncharacterized protein (TIGR02118 family)